MRTASSCASSSPCSVSRTVMPLTLAQVSFETGQTGRRRAPESNCLKQPRLGVHYRRRVIAIENRLERNAFMKRMVSAFVLCGTAAMVLPAQTFTTLHNFDNTDGAAPTGALVQGADANLYGTTTGELGINDNGTVFKISTNGAFTLLHSFDKTDGTLPYGGLIQDLTGNFYGTTISGGLNRPAYCSEGCGTVFEVTANGTLTTLYGFCFQPGCTDGAGPYAGLVQAANGDFYGTTTFAGGSNDHGTVFKMTADGALTTLHSFCSQSGCTDGYGAYTGLIQAANGELYGTTYYGGANGAGT